jgi:nitrogen fixation protein FixH
MSFIGRQGLPAGNGSSAWRWFPQAMILSLLAVIAVNILMAYYALSTFPGLAVANDFDTSNRYDEVLDRAQRQAALGWAVDAQIVEGRPVLLLKGADGQPLADVAIAATLQRPLGPPRTAHPSFAAQTPGRYIADAVVAEPGQWDLLLSVTASGHTLTTTRRLLAK